MPILKSFSGSVTSSFSFFTCSSISEFAIFKNLSLNNLVSSCFTLFISEATFFLFSGDTDPSFLNYKFNKPFLPKISPLTISTSSELWALISLSFNFSKSDIFTDYFLTEEKQ